MTTTKRSTAGKPFQLGTVIQGTLKPVDLLPAFYEAVCSLTPYNDYARIKGESGQAIRNGDFDSETSGILINNCMDVLCNIAPSFVFFGPRPCNCPGCAHGAQWTDDCVSNGADFGFWPDWDALDDAIATHPFGKLRSLYEEAEFIFDCVIVNVIGDSNVTVMNLDRNVLWTTVGGE